MSTGNAVVLEGGESRNYGIDLLRIICMIMIPVLHIMGKGEILTQAAKGSSSYNAAWLLEVLCYCAVNCFGLISGYVGYGKKVKYTNLFILWMRVFIFSAIICVLYLIFAPAKVEVTDIISSFFPTLTTSYWFFTAYFGLFLFMPILNKALEVLNESTLYLIAGILFIFFSVLPTCGSFVFSIVLNTDYKVMVNSLSLNEGYSVVWLSALYFFGGIMKKYNLQEKINNRINVLIYFACSLLAWGSLLIINASSKGSAPYNDYLIGYLSPLILIGSFSLVCLCANARIKENSLMLRMIKFFAPLCFDVYLIHMQPLIKKYALVGRFVFFLDFHPLVMILCIIGTALVIFFSCCVISEIRELISKALKIKPRLLSL